MKKKSLTIFCFCLALASLEPLVGDNYSVSHNLKRKWTTFFAIDEANLTMAEKLFFYEIFSQLEKKNDLNVEVRFFSSSTDPSKPGIRFATAFSEKDKLVIISKASHQAMPWWQRTLASTLNLKKNLPITNATTNIRPELYLVDPNYHQFTQPAWSQREASLRAPAEKSGFVLLKNIWDAFAWLDRTAIEVAHLGDFQIFQQPFERTFNDYRLMQYRCFDMIQSKALVSESMAVKVTSPKINSFTLNYEAGSLNQKKAAAPVSALCFFQTINLIRQKPQLHIYSYVIEAPQIYIEPTQVRLNFYKESAEFEKWNLILETKQPLLYEIEVKASSEVKNQLDQVDVYFATSRFQSNSNPSDKFLNTAGSHQWPKLLPIGRTELPMALFAHKKNYGRIDLNIRLNQQILQSITLSINEENWFLYQLKKAYIVSIEWIKTHPIYSLGILGGILLMLGTALSLSLLRKKRIRRALAATEGSLLEFSRLVYKGEKFKITARSNPFGHLIPNFDSILSLSLDENKIHIVKDKAPIAVEYSEKQRIIQINEIWQLVVSPQLFKNDEVETKAALLQLKRLTSVQPAIG